MSLLKYYCNLKLSIIGISNEANYLTLKHIYWQVCSQMNGNFSK